MKKILCKTLSLVLTAAMAAGMSVPATAEAGKAVKLSNKKISIKVGKKKTIKVKNSKKKVSWSIKKGKKYISLLKKKKTSVVVKGKKAGTAVVQAKAGAKKLKCTVTVSNKKETPKDTNKPELTPTPAQTNTPTAVPTATPTAEPTATPTAEPTATPTPTATPGPTYPASEFTYQGTSLDGIDTTKPMVAFTFDDGPIGNAETDNSMKIQALLKKYNAHASFFYIGGNINTEGRRDEIRQAMENGFDVGNHSWGYSSLDKSKEAAIRKSIGDTDAVLKEITGYDRFLFRAPNLATSQTMFGYINAPFIGCAVDSKDWNKASVEQIIENVKKAKDGDIVLMHETENNTADALETLLKYFVEENGFEVVSVTQLFAAKGKTLTTGKLYSSAS